MAETGPCWMTAVFGFKSETVCLATAHDGGLCAGGT